MTLARRRANVRARADLLRAVGLRHAWRRVRARRRHRRALAERAPRVAETMWRDAAAELGAEVRTPGPGLLEFRLDGATARVRGQRTPFADVVSREIANDKPLAYRILADAGIRIPGHVVAAARDHRAAASVLEQVGTPCVVKPVSGGGGEGVTGAITTRTQLVRALVSAARSGPRVLVEQQVEGDSYRVLLLDCVVLDVLRRARPRVTGDGRASIDELIFREFAKRIDDEGPGGLKHFLVDLDCLFTLARAGRGLETVPAAGEEVIVKTATNYNGPAETETVRAAAETPLADAARAAAGALGVRLAGVDVVTSDPARPLEETGGVVLEVNPVPGLTHHYNVRDAERATRVAVPILRALLEGS